MSSTSSLHKSIAPGTTVCWIHAGLQQICSIRSGSLTLIIHARGDKTHLTSRKQATMWNSWKTVYGACRSCLHLIVRSQCRIIEHEVRGIMRTTSSKFPKKEWGLENSSYFLGSNRNHNFYQGAKIGVQISFLSISYSYCPMEQHLHNFHL